MTRFIRHGLLGLVIALLASCGGGGGGGGGALAPVPAAGGTAGNAAGASTSGTDAGAAGSNSASTDSSTSGSSSTATGGGTGTGTGTSATSTAAAGDDAGVGSGGAGISTAASADAAGIGSVDGFGSIFVNGLRYNTDNTVYSVADAATLLIGATVKVTGPVSADFTSGVARQVTSAAELRGVVTALDAARGSFVILGTSATTDASTVWADLPGISGVRPGMVLQVWGLPGAPGELRATRIEQRPAALPILTGAVQGLNPGRGTLMLGNVTVDYTGAVAAGAFDAAALANGAIVRVRADVPPASGTLLAASVRLWNPVPQGVAVQLQLGGVVTQFGSAGSFRVLGMLVDASGVQVTGGPAGSLANGVRVEVAGTVIDGVLRASKLKLRHVPGNGGPASFSLMGTVGNFQSPASFRVRGQPVDASGPDVAFANGTAADLRNGVKVSVSGDQVVDGMLIANAVSFDR